MKKAIFVIAAIGITTAACSQSSANPGGSPDSAFVMKTAQGGMAEVELGKLALQKTMRDDVKQFAQMMVDEHSKAGDELAALATRKNITVPNDIDAEHQALRDRLSKLSGAEFDREYMDAMLSGHRTVADSFRTEASSGKDADVKTWAFNTLPTIEAHLARATDVTRAVQGPGSTQ